MPRVISGHPLRTFTIAVLALGLVITAIIVRNQAFGEGSSRSSDLVATSSGIEMSLDSYALTPNQTDFTFTVQLPEPAVSSQDQNVMPVPSTGTGLFLTNVAPHSSGSFGSSASPHLPGMTTTTKTIHLGPVQNVDQDIELRFTQLNFYLNDGQRTEQFEVEGEWTFRIASADIREALKPREAVTVDRTTEADGIEIMVERVEKGSDGLTVYWSVSPHVAEIHPAGPGLHLIMEDGSVVEQTKMARQSDVDWPVPAGATAEFSVTFPVVPSRGESVTISVDPFVTRLETTATVVVHDPLGDWSADTFEAGGDTFAVTKVEAHPEDVRILNIEISNTTPILEATAMFMGVGTEPPRVYDETGRAYQILSASTGMRRLDSGEMGAGTTTLSIAIPENASPSTLTIASPEMGKLLRGPWTTVVKIP